MRLLKQIKARHARTFAGLAALAWSGLSSQALAQDLKTAQVQLPGESQPRSVAYTVRDGFAFYQDDMILGRVDAAGRLLPDSGQVGTQSITVPEGSLWPDAVVPYVVDGDWGLNSQIMRNRVEAAIDHWEANTPLRFVRYNASLHTRYLSIVDDDPNECSAKIGAGSGKSFMRVGVNCDESTLIHEFGHVVGLHHEVARSDRDTFVRILWNNIKSDKRHNFCRRAGAPYTDVEKANCPYESPTGGVDRLGSYDYDSIMHYPGRAFLREDLPLTALTIERLKPGNIEDNRTLSAGDIAAVERLYAFASSSRGLAICAHPDEVCMTGDVNADGHEDLVAFHHGAYEGSSEVWVALSNRAGGYLAPKRWTTGFCGRADEVCKVGDFNGDGAADIVTFHHGAFGAGGQVFVYLSDRVGSFFYPGQPWANGFCARKQEVCDVGDFDRDGDDDIVTFHHGSNGSSQVFVYLSDRSRFFYPGKPWQASFCHAGMTCRVADVDGDLRADAVAFFQNAYSNVYANDVWVATSTGTELRQQAKWHENMCGPTDLCLVGDVNGDGRADAVSILGRLASGGSTPARTNVILAAGSKFEEHVIEGMSRCGIQASCGLADMDADGREDVFAYEVRGSTVWIGRSQLPD